MRELPFPPPKDCGEPPAGIEDPSIDDAFNFIDTDKSGKLSAEEGFEAFYCLVAWEALTQDEAFAAFDFIGGYAGEDEEVDKSELEEAFQAMSEMTDEEIAERVDGASMAE